MALEMPNLKIKTVKINELRSSEYNPRKWSESATKQLAESIRRFGLVDPILCNQAPGRENVVIGGHFRLKVAKEFPYKQFLKCYSCGASVVGEEKIRNYKNGNTRRFVCYHCSRQVDNSCREPFVREADIVSELMLMCDELITDTTKLEPGLRDAIDKFTKMMLVTHKTFGKKNMIGGYVKYVLAEGSQFEKTRLIRNLDVKLALHGRKLVKLTIGP